MKAVLLEGFGGLDVLKVGEVERPVPGENQVLVSDLPNRLQLGLLFGCDLEYH